MQIESIAIKNYRLFRDTKLENIPRLWCAVGANGTGKSTLFDVFSFRDALSMNVAKALAKRGDTARWQAGAALTSLSKSRCNSGWKSPAERLVTYVLRISRDQDGKPFVEREVLRYKRGAYGAPFRFLDFSAPERLCHHERRGLPCRTRN